MSILRCGGATLMLWLISPPLLLALAAIVPPLVLGAVGYTLGFVLMALVAVACLAVLAAIRPRAAAAAG